MIDGSMATLAGAYLTDLAIGDPRWFPHPVRGMGLAIAWGERIMRRVVPWERLAGTVLVIGIVGTSSTAAWWLLQKANAYAPWCGVLVAGILLSTCFSTRDLAVEAKRVFHALEANDLSRARHQVARIVGRETGRLNHEEVVRATVETIAESTLDGILSPLFFFVLGGVPGAVAYKAINTLDSMIGHRSARYIQFGWAAATLDTAANWIPARLSALFFVVAAWLCRYRATAAWRCAWRDGRGGPVPNAGIPEAAVAGALGVKLGGTNWYDGKAVEMPPMGDPIRPLDPDRIREAITIMYACSVTGWLAATGVLGALAAW